MVKYYGRARQRIGSVNTNQLGLKMSGCPSKVGRSGRIDRYISRRSHCGIVFCGWVWYHGIKWKQNHWVNPYTKEINWRCIPAAPVTRALAGGVGRLNAPRFRCAKDCGRQPWWSWTNQPHSSPLGLEPSHPPWRACVYDFWYQSVDADTTLAQYGSCYTSHGNYPHPAPQIIFILMKPCILTKPITIPNVASNKADDSWVSVKLVIAESLTITGDGALQVGSPGGGGGPNDRTTLIVGTLGPETEVPDPAFKGVINNYASIVVNPGGSLVINSVVNNLSDTGTITNRGRILINELGPPGTPTQGGLMNAGVIMLDEGFLTNNGVINNYAGKITNAAKFYNIGILQNFSSYVKPLDSGAPGDPSAGGTRPVPSIINTHPGVLWNGPHPFIHNRQEFGTIINGGAIIHNNGGLIYNTGTGLIKNTWLINNTSYFDSENNKMHTGKIQNKGVIISTTSYSALQKTDGPVPLVPPAGATCFWSQAGKGQIVNGYKGLGHAEILNNGTIIIQGPLESDPAPPPAPPAPVKRPSATQFQNNGILTNNKTGKIYMIDHSDHATSRGASQFNNGSTYEDFEAGVFNYGLFTCTTTSDCECSGGGGGLQPNWSLGACTTGTRGCAHITLYDGWWVGKDIKGCEQCL